MTPLNPPIVTSQVLNPDGTPTISWYQFFSGVYKRLGGTPGLLPLATFPVAGLPNPVSFPFTLIIVTGSVTGKTLATSNGVHWLWADGSIVS